MRISIPNTDGDGNSNRNRNGHGECNSYGYSCCKRYAYGNCYSNSDRYSHGYGDTNGHRDTNASGYTNTQTAPDAVTTLIGTTKMGTREQNSRVRHLWLRCRVAPRATSSSAGSVAWVARPPLRPARCTRPPRATMWRSGRCWWWPVLPRT